MTLPKKTSRRLRSALAGATALVASVFGAAGALSI
jgi:hypothetical protein